MQRETKRQRIVREFAMQKAGMALPDDSALERRRPGPAEHSDDDTPDFPVRTPVAVQRTGNRAGEESEMSSSSDDDGASLQPPPG